MSQLYASLFYQKDVTEIFSDSSLITYMIQVEVALAQAQAQVGVIPQNAANTIAQVAEQALEKFDFSALAVATGLAGNIAIPFVKQYRHQVMIGRTWLQQALPITLGHKLARWASAFKRDLDRIQAMKSRVLTAQLGGAVGSLASLQDQGSLVVSAFAKQLNLTVPTSTWHGERDRIVEIASVLGMIVGNTGKMARDWSLMMQTEIAELFEPTAKGRGGSSTMPHKRNPVAAASVLAAANRVPALMSSIYQSMVQEHERSLGAWHAEWLAIPEIFLF